MLTIEDINLLLKRFPLHCNELCYEKITHKKVLGSNIILAIPEGKKYFAWFTIYKNDNVCLLLEINSDKHIVDVKIVVTKFMDNLSLGTIFYGTLFNNKNMDYFCIEDMYYYSGKSYVSSTYLNKLKKINDIFKNEISQTALTDKYTIFGLPLMSDDLQLILKDIQLLPYNISDIKFRFFNNVNSKEIYVMKYFKPGFNKHEYNKHDSNKHDNMLRKHAVFKIMADIEPDIYNLFAYKDGMEEYYDIAFIPDYKTSVMMNKLFRKIKENDNLDAIEESDDEEEFEDNREDKYVYLDKSFKMNCEYIYKFKRWCPISLASNNDRIINMASIKNSVNDIQRKY